MPAPPEPSQDSAGGEAGPRSVASMIAGLWILTGPMLSMIDSSVVNVAIPAMSHDLKQPLDTVQWVLSGYLLALAIGLPAAAWLGRRFGLRRGYVATLGLFVLASAACAFAPNVGILITARILQGLLGAPMVPLGIGLLLGGGRESRNIPASVGILFFAAPALGPAIGGLLVTSVGWRSIFLVNLPLGLAALAGARISGRADPGDRGSRAARLDVPGLVALGAGLGMIEYGTSEAPLHGLLAPATWLWYGGGAAILAGYGLWARWLKGRRRIAPAVDLHMLTSAGRVVTLALCSNASIILYAVLFIAPVYLQILQGHSAAVAGLALLPQGVIMALTTRFGNRVIQRAGLHSSVAIGMALLMLSSVGLLLLGQRTAVWITALILSGRGVALGLVVQPLTQTLLGGLEPAQVPDANTLFSMSQRLAGSVGVAMLASLFTSRARSTGSPITALHECALAMAGMAAIGTTAALLMRQVSRGTAQGRVAESAGEPG
jgi:EmrB/QacA subfamily drug resistance transporter